MVGPREVKYAKSSPTSEKDTAAADDEEGGDGAGDGENCAVQQASEQPEAHGVEQLAMVAAAQTHGGRQASPAAEHAALGAAGRRSVLTMLAMEDDDVMVAPMARPFFK